jgi:cholesterol oxidase
VVGHGVGAAALLMALASGAEGIRSAVCLQFGMHVVAASKAQLDAGLHLPSFLHGHHAKAMDPYVDTHSGWRSEVWDEAYRIRHLRDKEGCNSPVCHRLTYMYGLLFHHDNVNAGTHAALHELFGPASVEMFEELQTWERNGHLVDATGAETYMTHLDRLAIPMTFIHGADDRCVLPAGTEATVAELKQANGDELYELHVVPGYGHVDCLVGKNVMHDIYPLILERLLATSPKVLAGEA